MSTSSPAQLYAVTVGSALVIAGILGFFYSASFDTGDGLRSDDVLGILAVNAWHNIFHILTGLLGLLAAGYAARTYALGLGLLYAVLAIWGFLAVDDGVGSLLEIIPLNSEDNVLHLALGLLGLGAGAATPKDEPRSRPPRERETEPA